MIVGLGIDLLENSRVERELARSEWLASDGVFTPRESIAFRTDTRPAARYAASFAAKEAAAKALGVPASMEMFRHAELLAQEGRDQLVLSQSLESRAREMGVRQIWLSLARTPGKTVAMVILET